MKTQTIETILSVKVTWSEYKDLNAVDRDLGLNVPKRDLEECIRAGGTNGLQMRAGESQLSMSRAGRLFSGITLMTIIRTDGTGC